jgi:hypothetical protein
VCKPDLAHAARTYSCTSPAKAVATSHLDQLTVTFGCDCRWTIRWDQTEAPVRSTGVVMIDKDPDGVRAFRINSQSQTLGPHEPFRDPVRLRRVNQHPNLCLPQMS